MQLQIVLAGGQIVQQNDRAVAAGEETFQGQNLPPVA
jgi:hypothetical protein